MKKQLSTRMRNQMNAYIGKSYDYYHNGRTYYWTIIIVALMGETGYFITEVKDGEKVWESNASYGEITHNVKKGIFVEVMEVQL